MGQYGRRDHRRARREANERENTRMRCEKHGYYNPWQRTLGGWRQGECPKCAATRYEETMRRLEEEKAGR